MGQEDVLNVLEKKGGWMTTKEIADELKCNQGTISSLCRKLHKRYEIVRRDAERGYKWKENICKN